MNPESLPVLPVLSAGKEMIEGLRELDPTRAYYSHAGAYAGDAHTVNRCLDLIPLQEREEWLSDWARKVGLTRSRQQEPAGPRPEAGPGREPRERPLEEASDAVESSGARRCGRRGDRLGTRRA